jgi:hypothetical protein
MEWGEDFLCVHEALFEGMWGKGSRLLLQPRATSEVLRQYYDSMHITKKLLLGL